ncbi:hypothetical protein CPB83DRAFT_849635 [Crepidotus variabilis]|uniref:Uncharacterized protein n=1 Tax=Crepidotus variabilis TaxID=179855 RepID=A0A9P6EK56_9AGAR|nr:hypothetical protein CPB83DRAFT_849635 [Crepidotus variabilis]
MTETAKTLQKRDVFSEIMGNEDTISLIFQMLAVNVTMDLDTKKKTRKMLYNMALLGRAFTGPALNSLWKVLPSMLPLFRLLPAFGLFGNTFIVEDIQEDDWLILDTYARRVRVLCLDSKGPAISPFVYMMLSRARSSPILPALKELRLLDNHPGNLSDAFLSMGPNVEVLEFGETIVTNTEFLTPFILTALQQSSVINEFRLRGSHTIDLRFVSKFSSLRRLELKLTNTHLTPQFFTALGHLDDLSDIQIHVGAPLPTAAPVTLRKEASGLSSSRRSRKHKFRSLKSFSATGSISLLSRLLEFVELRNVTSFRIQEEANSTGIAESHWNQCFQSLSTSTQLEELEIVQFQQTNSYAGVCLEARWMTPLCSLSHLKTLAVKNASFGSSDTDISTLISSFPLLKTLILPEICHASNGSFMSTDSLINIANGCPLLEELRIPIGEKFLSARILGAFQNQLIDSLKRPLRTLTISTSFGRLPNPDVVLLAQLVFRTFSYLHTLEGSGPNAANESWPQVREIYQAIQAEVKTFRA